MSNVLRHCVESVPFDHFLAVHVDQDQLTFVLRTNSFSCCYFLSVEFDDSFGNPDSMKETGLRKRYVYSVLFFFTCSTDNEVLTCLQFIGFWTCF